MRNKKKHIISNELKKSIELITRNFDRIPQARFKQLEKIALFVLKKLRNKQEANLLFICTHNSRRSLMAQITSQTAVYYYNVENINCFSGGIEVTSFNSNAVKSIESFGFEVVRQDRSENPVYLVKYSDDSPEISVFSKIYNNKFNPQVDFTALMTCSHADKNCPYIIGANSRFSIPYDDPKEFDGTDKEEEKYSQSLFLIATEMFFLLKSIRDEMLQ